MRVIFFGTPEYAVPSLQAIYDSNHTVVAVVSQPDKAKGRSNKLVHTPVKELALKYNTPVFQFEKIRQDDISGLLDLNADIMVSCAYGQIFDRRILDATPNGVINLHGSILPKYRGSSPVQWALINNEKTTGVTILRSDLGMDDGKVLCVRTIEIDEDDNAISLFDKLSKLSSEMIVPALDLIESGNAHFVDQDETLATRCKMLSQDMSKLDFNDTADKLVGKIKGLAMWPNANITIDGVYFKLYNAKKYRCDLDIKNYSNGEVVIANNKQGLVLKCENGFVEITELLPINSKKMTAKSYLNGKQIKLGSIAE